jgi:hypothetical protein
LDAGKAVKVPGQRQRKAKEEKRGKEQPKVEVFAVDPFFSL